MILRYHVSMIGEMNVEGTLRVTPRSGESQSATLRRALRRFVARPAVAALSSAGASVTVSLACGYCAQALPLCADGYCRACHTDTNAGCLAALR